ncbi:hypothetical protein [Streptomyces inhibens]|uniref:hypothetical protein n=1 Tax=Streptomyces inhibens TaxID=2293571 RepID=UPI001EE697FB|nr:hypothetical protein [Streptomyces inhibens]UKY48402.1 hypothetical protein KI385_06010 [Streptomyces inhibens]
MEPRELWERHAVLAQAFCSSDDEVRRTQGLLDEAEARRSRTLAAFAVTVGSDAVVADLLGLEEREVRLARRTVGKDDARAVAKSLLAQPACEEPPAEQPPAQQATAHPEGQATAGPATTAPVTEHRTTAGPPAAPHTAAPHTATPHAAPPQAPAPQTGEPGWAPALDAVLMSSWHTGVDLTALAAELGLDVRLLVARAQQLSAENRHTPPPQSDRTGRHRRMAKLQSTPQPETPHLAWRERTQQPPGEHYEHEPWKQQPYQNYQHYQSHQNHQNHQNYPDYQTYQVYEEQQPSHAPATWDANAITAAQHDWDGILSHWEATTSTTPPLSAPGHGGT